jgi:hypothetical protein
MNQPRYKNLKKKKLLHFGIVCNDAGGANIIFNTLKNIKYKKISIYVTGPSIKISKRFFPGKKNYKNLNKFFNRINILITGTSLKSNLEHRAREIAKKKQIKSITILDHWVNYKLRFIRKNKSIMPDEIWVTDSKAYKIASKIFPLTKIICIKNFYLINQLKKINPTKKIKKNELLYISEPIKKNNKKIEFLALKYFLKRKNLLNLPSDTKIRFRLHPSEPKNKYSNFLKKNSKHKIFIDKYINVNSSINKSKWVVGGRSFALYIALKMGRKVYCSLPSLNGINILPFKKIIYINKLN